MTFLTEPVDKLFICLLAVSPRCSGWRLEEQPRIIDPDTRTAILTVRL